MSITHAAAPTSRTSPVSHPDHRSLFQLIRTVVSKKVRVPIADSGFDELYDDCIAFAGQDDMERYIRAEQRHFGSTGAGPTFDAPASQTV